MRKTSVWLGIMFALVGGAPTLAQQPQPPSAQQPPAQQSRAARELNRQPGLTAGQAGGERRPEEPPFGSRILPLLGFDSSRAPRPETRDYGGINRLAPLAPPAFQPETLALPRLPQPLLRQSAPAAPQSAPAAPQSALAAPQSPPVRLNAAASLNPLSGTLSDPNAPSAAPDPAAPARPGAPSPASPFQPLGGFAGAPLGNYTGAPLNAYPGASLGAFIGAPAGAFIGQPLDAAPGAPLSAAPAAPLNSYAGPPLNAATGVPLFVYIGPPQGSLPAVFGDPLLALTAADALALRLLVMDLTLLSLTPQPLTPNALAPLAFAAPPVPVSGQPSDASRSADQPPPFSRVITPNAPPGAPPASRTQTPPARNDGTAMPILP
jgi:hypothetical protein